MKCKTGEELYAHMKETFDLTRQSIIFGVLDVGDGEQHVLPGLFDCSGDLWEDSKFYDIALSYCNDPEIHIISLETYMIGEGEAEHACEYDTDCLEEIAKESPKAWDELLGDIADCLCVLDDFSIENPAYEKPYDAGWGRM